MKDLLVGFLPALRTIMRLADFWNVQTGTPWECCHIVTTRGKKTIREAQETSRLPFQDYF